MLRMQDRERFILQSQERRVPVVMALFDGFDDAAKARLARLGLLTVSSMPVLRAHRALMTTMVERYRIETCSFLLPTGEITIRLEDVYFILKLPIHGRHVRYDMKTGRRALVRVFGADQLVLSQNEREMDYEVTLAAGGDPFALFLCVLIGGVVTPNRRGRGFSVGWEGVIEVMVVHGTIFA